MLIDEKKEVVFVLNNVEGWERIREQTPESIDVYVLDAKGNALEQMVEKLREVPKIDAIHFISHADTARVDIGNDWLNNDSLSTYQNLLEQVGASLKPEGDILLYGCNAAVGAQGQLLIDQLSKITKANLAASNNLTGQPSQGEADWELEYHSIGSDITASMVQYELPKVLLPFWLDSLLAKFKQSAVVMLTTIAATPTIPITHIGSSVTKYISGIVDDGVFILDLVELLVEAGIEIKTGEWEDIDINPFKDISNALLKFDESLMLANANAFVALQVVSASGDYPNGITFDNIQENMYQNYTQFKESDPNTAYVLNTSTSVVALVASLGGGLTKEALKKSVKEILVDYKDFGKELWGNVSSAWKKADAAQKNKFIKKYWDSWAGSAMEMIKHFKFKNIDIIRGNKYDAETIKKLGISSDWVNKTAEALSSLGEITQDGIKITLAAVMRASNPESLKWIDLGHIAKSVSIKANTMQDLDFFLNPAFSKSGIAYEEFQKKFSGLVGVYKPKDFTPELVKDYFNHVGGLSNKQFAGLSEKKALEAAEELVKDRIKSSLKNSIEFTEKKIKNLTVDEFGRIKGDDLAYGKALDGGPRYVTGDYDNYTVVGRDAAGKEVKLNSETHKAVMDKMTESGSGIYGQTALEHTGVRDYIGDLLSGNFEGKLKQITEAKGKNGDFGLFEVNSRGEVYGANSYKNYIGVAQDLANVSIAGSLGADLFSDDSWKEYYYEALGQEVGDSNIGIYDRQIGINDSFKINLSDIDGIKNKPIAGSQISIDGRSILTTDYDYLSGKINVYKYDIVDKKSTVLLQDVHRSNPISADKNLIKIMAGSVIYNTDNGTSINLSDVIDFKHLLDWFISDDGKYLIFSTAESLLVEDSGGYRDRDIYRLNLDNFNIDYISSSKKKPYYGAHFSHDDMIVYEFALERGFVLKDTSSGDAIDFKGAEILAYSNRGVYYNSGDNTFLFYDKNKKTSSKIYIPSENSYIKNIENNVRVSEDGVYMLFEFDRANYVVNLDDGALMKLNESEGVNLPDYFNSTNLTSNGDYIIALKSNDRAVDVIKNPLKQKNVGDFIDLSISSPNNIWEGDSNSKIVNFKLMLDAPAASDVTAYYYTSSTGSTATVGEDYLRTYGEITIPKGQWSVNIPVEVLGDTKVEADESIRLYVTGVQGAKLGGNVASVFADVTILNDDIEMLPVVWASTHLKVFEKDSTTSKVRVPVNLSSTYSQDVQVSYQTISGAAQPSQALFYGDYNYRNGVLTIKAGEKKAYIDIYVVGDYQVEKDKDFYVELTSVSNGRFVNDGVAGRFAKITIYDNDFDPLDRVAPTLVKASMVEQSLVLQFDKSISQLLPNADQFQVLIDGEKSPVLSLEALNNEVYLRLQDVALVNSSVTISYNDASNEMFALQDRSGNHFSSISNVKVENSSNDYYKTEIFGTNSSDFIVASINNELIDGLGGVDTVVFHGQRDQFILTLLENNEWSVSSAQGADKLINIERLQFDNATVALDIDGNGGQAYRLYQAAFDRVPDEVGLGYWVKFLDNGGDLFSVASGFVGSLEFKSLYGSSPTAAELVTRFYQNVLHREPEIEGWNFWVNTINSGELTASMVLSQFSESPENKANLLGVLSDGFSYIPFV